MERGKGTIEKQLNKITLVVLIRPVSLEEGFQNMFLYALVYHLRLCLCMLGVIHKTCRNCHVKVRLSLELVPYLLSSVSRSEGWAAPDPAVLSCSNTQRWKGLNSAACLGVQGAQGVPEERAGEIAVWDRVGRGRQSRRWWRKMKHTEDNREDRGRPRGFMRRKREDDAVAESRFPGNKFRPPKMFLLSGPLMPPLRCLFTPPLPSRLHTIHLPSVLPHRRVRILGRCWVSTVSQLNKTIWKQSGPVNVPAQSDPSPFVAVEKNGLSESRGWRAGRGRHTISIHRLSPPMHPPRPAFTTASSPPHTHPHFLVHPSKVNMLSETEPSVLQYLQEQDTPSFYSFFLFYPLPFALFPLQISYNVTFIAIIWMQRSYVSLRYWKRIWRYQVI